MLEKSIDKPPTPLTLLSWNVNGIRSVLAKNRLTPLIAEFRPDIICFQETKARREQFEAELTKHSAIELDQYHSYWHSALRPGYSGTAIFTKIPPLRVLDQLPEPIRTSFPNLTDQFGDPLSEGRLQILEFIDFFLVNVYTPNSKPDLSRLKLRHQSWDPLFRALLLHLETQKPVITCGDFNAAHTDIDLARPKQNQKSAGFTIEERQGISQLISAGFIDTFRQLHPDTIQYTWWSHYASARAKNIGWRIDYFFLSSNLLPSLAAAAIHDHFTGSDHCPISITLNLPGQA